VEASIHSLILLRGLPGAGKSTLAGILAENRWPVYSVDDFFTDVNGNYHFEFDKNHLAYAQCVAHTEEAMKRKEEKIFVHNTFTLEWEMEPYFKMAATYSYRVFVVTVENRHHSANVHNIPDGQVRKMAEKYKVVLY